MTESRHTSGPAVAPGWQLDELTAVGRENLDPEHVARYDDKEDADATTEVELIRSLGIGPDAVVVDVGAGTGQFALAAADAFGRVVAVDPSPVMLSTLRATAQDRGSRLDVVEAGFLTYQHRGLPPDAVYSRWALHHLPDFWKSIALHRLRAMLRPRSVFRLCDIVFAFDPWEAEEHVEAWCEAVGSNDSEWTRADAEEHIRDEHSTYTWVLEPMLERAGFAIRDAVYSDDRFLAQYVLLAQ